jgi:carbon monoxide dehydrogenase subunit G
MELEHSFTVPVPKSRAWDVLLDVERVAPCMPGATLDSVDGDEIRGRIKVKVGPINMTYAGTARFVERDQELGVVTLEASGKETRGAGTASASVRSVLEDGGHETHVKVLTTLNVTGKPAQFGRGVLNEVGGRLLGIFATNLAATLAEDPAASPDPSANAGSPAGDSAAAAGPASASIGADTTAQAATSATAITTPSELPIDDLKLPARATSSLHKNGIATVGELASKNADELLAIDGIGPASVDDIRGKLSDLGLTLGQPPAPTGAAPAASAPAAAPAGVPAQTATAAAAESAQAAPAPGPAKAVPHASAARHAAHQLEDEAINLLKVAGMPVLKRAIPVLAGVVAALVIGLRRKARRRKH